MATERVKRLHVVEGNYVYLLYTLLKHSGYEIDIGYEDAFGPLSNYRYLSIHPNKMRAYYRETTQGYTHISYGDNEHAQIKLLDSISLEAQMALLLSFGTFGPSGD